MPELLLELFSEEIPARMQRRAAEDLRSLATNALVDAGLTYEGAQAHATPRRLVLSIEGLAARASDVVDERRGPRVDASQASRGGESGWGTGHLGNSSHKKAQKSQKVFVLLCGAQLSRHE